MEMNSVIRSFITRGVFLLLRRYRLAAWGWLSEGKGAVESYKNGETEPETEPETETEIGMSGNMGFFI